MIARLFQNSKRIFRKGLLLRYSAVPPSFVLTDDSPFIVLFAVPRSFGKAVQRNYVRRLLRQLLYETLKEMIATKEKQTQSFYLIFTPHHNFLQLAYHEQKKEMRLALQKLLSFDTKKTL